MGVCTQPSARIQSTLVPIGASSSRRASSESSAGVLTTDLQRINDQHRRGAVVDGGPRGFRTIIFGPPLPIAPLLACSLLGIAFDLSLRLDMLEDCCVAHRRVVLFTQL